MALIFDETFTGGAPVEAGATVVGAVTFPAGKSGEGALFGAGGYISYDTENNFNFNKGTVIMWYKPTSDMWSLYPHDPLCLLNAYWGASKELYYYIAPATTVYLRPDFYRGGGVLRPAALTEGEPYLASSMLAGVWYKVSLFWDFTLADNYCYIVMKVNDMFSGIGFTTAYDAGAITGGSKMYLGNAPYGTPAYSRSCLGMIDSVKIYNTVELTLPAGGMYDIPYTFNPHVPATVTPVLNVLADTEVINNHEFHPNALAPIYAGAVGDDVFFYKTPPYDPVYQNRIPVDATDTPGFSLSYQVVKNATEYIFFNVYTNIALANCELDMAAGGFTGDGTIAKNTCDLRVVDNWFQSARNKSPYNSSLPYMLPGLFLHNDQINGANPSTGTRLDENTALTLTNIPVLPVETKVKTVMTDHTSKQFALKIPATSTSGSYTTTVTLTADGGVNVVLTINLTILPFELVSDGTIRVGDVSYHQWDPVMGIDPWDSFVADLAEIKEKGFNWLWLDCSLVGTDPGQSNYYSPMTLAEVTMEQCRLARAAGFDQVFYHTAAAPQNDTTKDWQIPLAIAAMLFYGYEPWLYTFDELGPSSGDAGHGQAHHARFVTVARAAAIAQGAAIKIVGTCGQGGAEEAEAAGYPLDMVFYTLLNTDVMAIMAGGARDYSLYQSTYWQSRDYQNNRYEHGYGNYLRRFDGTPDYGRMGISFCTAYNDSGRIAVNHYQRPYGHTYPAVDGSGNYIIIPSHRGEIVREGIKDERFLHTWKYYYDRVITAHPTEAAASKAIIDALVVKYTDTAVIAYAAPQRITQKEYADDRAAIIAQIEYLRGFDTAVSSRRSVISGVITAMWKRFRKIGGVSQ